eukprot:2617826-Prymnesium_polylepis.1
MWRVERLAYGGSRSRLPACAHDVVCVERFHMANFALRRVTVRLPTGAREEDWRTWRTVGSLPPGPLS